MHRHKHFDAFLSHSSVDKPLATTLKRALQAKGLRVWLDRDEIRPGDLFVGQLETGIEECKSVVLIISPDSMESGWVKEEYSRALSLAQEKGESLQLIPVILREATLPGFLANRNWVDFRDAARFDKNVEKLVWGITGIKPDKQLSEFWSALPDPSPFFGRQAEIATLMRWIVVENCKVIDITGQGGIGKTSLVAQLAKAIKVENRFRYMYETTLKNAPNVTAVIENWIRFLVDQEIADVPSDLNSHLELLMRQLKAEPGLLVLDNAEGILVQQSRGGYLPGCEGYGTLIQRLATEAHRGCLLLTSREPLPEISRIEGEKGPVRRFHLKGLGPDDARMVVLSKRERLRGTRPIGNPCVTSTGGMP